MQGSIEIKPLIKRAESRSEATKNYRVEIKLEGEPIYQFGLINISKKGAGILVKNDPAFLKIIELGQIVEVNFISSKALNLSGMYTAEIKHITKFSREESEGQRLVGISIQKKLDEA
jgi:hypothetical protein